MSIEGKVILGIDPGTRVLGYGVINVNKGSLKLIDSGIIDLRRIDNSYEKLRTIFQEVNNLIRLHQPNEMSIEAPFFGKNVQSMLKLGRAQGIAIASAINNGIPIFEYAPKMIKQAISGKGSASKEQVAALVSAILKLGYIPHNLDTTDAIAAAITHAFQFSPVQSVKKVGTSWESYLKQNPQRLKK